MILNRIGYNSIQYAPRSKANEEVVLFPPGAAVKDKEAVAEGIFTKKNDTVERALKRLGIKECKTCKQRKYQDVSNDPGVSFKYPAHIPPELAGAVVAAHENEHVAHEQAKAKEEGREILYQSVQISTSICPECGRVYVSGGRTTTVTRKRPSWELNSGLIVDKYV